MDLVKDHAILLTGSTGRIGAATLETLLREGAHVAVLSRELARAQAAIDKLDAGYRAQARAVQGDVSVMAQADAAVADCISAFGRVDAVVNLAGAGWRKKPLIESSLEDLRATLAEVVEPTFNLVAAAVRAILKQPYRDGARSRGRIVTVSATSATNPNPGFPLYSTAKGGVNSLMLSLARDYKGDGIVANAVLLGGVNFPGSEKFRSAEDNAIVVSAAEVADVLTFLASDRATGINGELLTLRAREVD